MLACDKDCPAGRPGTIDGARASGSRLFRIPRRLGENSAPRNRPPPGRGERTHVSITNDGCLALVRSAALDAAGAAAGRGRPGRAPGRRGLLPASQALGVPALARRQVPRGDRADRRAAQPRGDRPADPQGVADHGTGAAGHRRLRVGVERPRAVLPRHRRQRVPRHLRGEPRRHAAEDADRAAGVADPRRQLRGDDCGRRVADGGRPAPRAGRGLARDGDLRGAGPRGPGHLHRPAHSQGTQSRRRGRLAGRPARHRLRRTAGEGPRHDLPVPGQGVAALAGVVAHQGRRARLGAGLAQRRRPALVRRIAPHARGQAARHGCDLPIRPGDPRDRAARVRERGIRRG